ncbi:MAG: serine/threonine-protein phosphatase [Desulfovibrio sp.]|nr:MAG: serine/threonine-protein phosphatase [Desulfovibrio sp.]
MITLESAALTDVGKKRKGNEDSFFRDDDLQLYVVADGMGGHQAGEVASNLLVETVQGYMRRFQEEEGDVDELEDSDDSLSQEANRLVSSVYLANRVVNQFALSRDTYTGMGTTVSAVSFTEDSFVAVNVGDSPIFLIRDNKIQVISVFHTVEAEQALLDPEGKSKLGKQFSHMLTRAIGTKESVEADATELIAKKDDILVISSDGMSDKVKAEEVLDLVAKSKPDKACRSLVNLALDRGGDDNITVVIIKVKKLKSTKTTKTAKTSKTAKKGKKKK